MAGADYMAASPQNRARLQISILGHWLPLSEEVMVFRALWQHTGTVVNHQALFCHIDWSTGHTPAERSLLSSLLDAISPEAELVGCPGASFNLVQLLDNSPRSRHGFQWPTTFDEIAIKKLMHKESQSVFGRIHFFSVFQYLVNSLVGSGQMEWTLSTPNLSKLVFLFFQSTYI